MKRNKFLNKNKFFSWLDSRILVFIIILVVIVLANVLMDIFFESDKDFRIIPRPFIPAKGDIELKSCLIKEDYSKQCENLFLDPSNYKVCENLKELEDQCYYRFAISSQMGDFCEKIKDYELKSKCYTNFPNVH